MLSKATTSARLDGAGKQVVDTHQVPERVRANTTRARQPAALVLILVFTPVSTSLPFTVCPVLTLAKMLILMHLIHIYSGDIIGIYLKHPSYLISSSNFYFQNRPFQNQKALTTVNTAKTCIIITTISSSRSLRIHNQHHHNHHLAHQEVRGETLALLSYVNAVREDS